VGQACKHGWRFYLLGLGGRLVFGGAANRTILLSRQADSGRARLGSRAPTEIAA
jgi:hypothetical protein